MIRIKINENDGGDTVIIIEYTVYYSLLLFLTIVLDWFFEKIRNLQNSNLVIFDLATVKSEERYSLRTVISLNVF